MIIAPYHQTWFAISSSLIKARVFKIIFMPMRAMSFEFMPASGIRIFSESIFSSKSNSAYPTCSTKTRNNLVSIFRGKFMPIVAMSFLCISCGWGFSSKRILSCRNPFNVIWINTVPHSAKMIYLIICGWFRTIKRGTGYDMRKNSLTSSISFDSGVSIFRDISCPKPTSAKIWSITWNWPIPVNLQKYSFKNSTSYSSIVHLVNILMSREYSQ